MAHGEKVVEIVEEMNGNDGRTDEQGERRVLERPWVMGLWRGGERVRLGRGG